MNKRNIADVLTMNKYTEEGQKNMLKLAEIVNKIGDLISGEELYHVFDIVDGGHTSEFLDLVAEKIKNDHPSVCRLHWRDTI